MVAPPGERLLGKGRYMMYLKLCDPYLSVSGVTMGRYTNLGIGKIGHPRGLGRLVSDGLLGLETRSNTTSDDFLTKHLFQ